MNSMNGIFYNEYNNIVETDECKFFHAFPDKAPSI